jgi:predicted secreted protein
MKKIILSMLAIATLTLTSCNSDNASTPNPNEVAIDATNFKGTLESGKEATLDASKTYYLTGSFIVKDGAKLTIPAGTVIKATENTDGAVRYIGVSQGAQIFINGTATNPVVMTSAKATPAKSDWGGLVICGKAPINTSATAGGTASAEVSDLTYGGSNTTDNSGIIKYLRIEYTGYAYSATKEFNGLSLFGVGSGTTLEYVHANHNGDDGIEFFGGTVNGKYLVSTDSDDDSIDFADGWAGTGEFWYIKNTAKAGIEGSNNGTNGAATPMTNATLKNISIVKGTLPNSEHALYIKEGGGKWTASNIYIDGAFTKGIKISSTDTPALASVTAGTITFNPIQFANTAVGFVNSEYTGTNTTYITIGNNTGAGNGATAPSWTAGWTAGL